MTLGVTLIRRHDLRSSTMDTCEEPANPKKVKAELGGGSARAFFLIIIHKLLYYYMFITIVAHSLFSSATGPRRMALTVNRVHNNNIYAAFAFALALTRSLRATTGHIANASLSLSLWVTIDQSILFTAAANAVVEHNNRALVWESKISAHDNSSVASYIVYNNNIQHNRQAIWRVFSLGPAYLHLVILQANNALLLL